MSSIQRAQIVQPPCIDGAARVLLGLGRAGLGIDPLLVALRLEPLVQRALVVGVKLGLLLGRRRRCSLLLPILELR